MPVGKFVMILRSSFLTTSAVGIGYVLYSDFRRKPRMMETFSKGSILPPLVENPDEIRFFERPKIEKQITSCLKSTFSNEYYVIHGEVGSGKSRLLLEIVKQMRAAVNQNGGGAPIYVLASQGSNFSDSLGKAVGFNFDEHVNLMFFVKLLLRIYTLPPKDENSKLIRCLEAIETVGYAYARQHGRPAVIVIDGVNWLSKNRPDAVERIQEKAKLWADCNIVKVVLVTNDEATIDSLQANPSGWVRAGPPILVGDLNKQEATEFLNTIYFDNANRRPMGSEYVDKVIGLAGGRIHHLIVFKRDFDEGIPFEITASRVMNKERDKFIEVTKHAGCDKVMQELLKSPSRSLSMKKLIQFSSREDIDLLAKKNIIKYERESKSILVKYESVLTENVAREIVGS